MYEKDNSELEALEGPVQFAHQYVDMPNYSVQIEDAVNGPTTVRKFEKIVTIFRHYFSNFKPGETMYASFGLCLRSWMRRWCWSLRLYTRNDFR